MVVAAAVTNGASNGSGVSKEAPPRTLLEVVRGHLLYLALMAIALPIWVYQGALALLGVIALRGKFWHRKDRENIVFPDPFPLEHNYVKANGLKFHCVTAGGGRGKPLMLFLHGFPELWYSWRYQLEEFQDDFEVAAIDMRGYGQSDKPPGRAAYRIDVLVGDIAAVIDALGHSSCTLVAHDWGGNIAWHTAAMHPDKVDRLVVMGLPHPCAWSANFDLNQFRRSWYILMFQAPALPEALFGAMDVRLIDDALVTGKNALFAKDAVSAEDVERYKQAISRPGACTAALNYYRSFLDSEIRSPSKAYRDAKHRLATGQLPMPVLMLYAGNDAALGPQLVRGTDRFVPNLELHVLENCSHWVQQDAAPRVRSLMRAWLDRTATELRAAPAAAGAV